MKQWNIQLKDHVTGKSILEAGGVAYVATAGGFSKVALLTSSGAVAANPSALVRGQISFNTSDDVTSVDLYVSTPSGHFVKARGIEPSGPNELAVDTGTNLSVWQIPFAIGDTAANTETDTEFDIPANAVILPVGVGVHVGVLDATETIDVGTATGESGDPDGLIDGLTVATAVFHKATLADGAATLGVLLSVDESGGDLVPESHVGLGKSVVYTLSAGADTAEGIIVLPVMPAAA